jgi:hypothetical protein
MRISFLLFLAFIPLVCFSEKRTLNGYLGVEGGEIFSYKLEFSELSGGKISGIATTWKVPGKDVSAKIEGVVDKKNKTLSFSEKEIVYNTGFASRKTICLITAKLKFARDENNVFVLAGQITSNDVSNVMCAKGSISFGNLDEIIPVFQEDKQAVKTPTSTTVFKSPTEKKVVHYISNDPDKKPITTPINYNTNAPIKITTGIEKVFDCVSDSVTIEFWDNSRVDGDVISVSYNGKILFENYSLVTQKKVVRLPLENEENELVITAINEGSEEPNTTDILMHDGTLVHSLIAYNSIGKKSIIKIRKHKK